MNQSVNPLRHKLSLITCSAALALPLQAAGAGRDTTEPEARPLKRLGGRSAWVIGVEGVASVHHYAYPEQQSSWRGAGGGTVRTTSTGSTDSASLFTSRLGVDWFVLEHVSVGLAARYNQGTNRGATTTEGDGSQVSSGYSSSTRSLGLAPRIGMAFTSAAGFGVWARAQLDHGTTWSLNRTGGSGSGSLAFLAGSNPSSETHWSSSLTAGIEALGTYAPREDVVLMAGPWLTKRVATFHDSGNISAGSDGGSPPPAYGLTVGAGLLL